VSVKGLPGFLLRSFTVEEKTVDKFCARKRVKNSHRKYLAKGKKISLKDYARMMLESSNPAVIKEAEAWFENKNIVP